jgi:tRNA pseudouridine55 synthase
VARRRQAKGRPIDGILVLDKPAGMTSNGALQIVKSLYYAAKAGHTGSLDPLATGVLPICFGEATKFSQFLLDSDKAYHTTIVLGVATDSGDADGQVIAEHDASGLEQARLEEALEQFRGAIKQVPSMFSAIKVNGQPLYKLARQGKEIEREARDVNVYELQLLAYRPGKQAEVDLSIRCSKGTYIRSIAEDLGKILGCGGHVSVLRRTEVGPYLMSDAVTLDRLQGLRDNREFTLLDDFILPLSSALGHLPEVALTENAGFYIRQGQPVLVPHMPTQGMVRISMESGEFLGVGEILDDGRVAPRRLVVS